MLGLLLTTGRGQDELGSILWARARDLIWRRIGASVCCVIWTMRESENKGDADVCEGLKQQRRQRKRWRKR
jgi:hypothetical protein